MLEEARRTGEYYRFSLALFTYAEDEGRRAYSAVAMDRGDLDLAASLAPVGSVQAVAVEELRKRRACGEAMREELEKSAEKWGIAFLSSPDSVVLVQVPEGIVLEANQKFKILIG